VGFWLYVALWLPYTALVFVYGIGSPWYSSAIGRAFFLSKLALCLLTSFILSIFLFGRYPWLEEVRAGLLTLLGVAAWYQLVAVLRIQRQAPQPRLPPSPFHRHLKEPPSSPRSLSRSAVRSSTTLRLLGVTLPLSATARLDMALNDPALIVGATAIKNAITHMQLHSTVVGGTWSTNAVGSRVAVTGAVDADGDITWGPVNFTGLPALQPVLAVSYWSASTAGTNYGGAALVGDLTANSAGDYTITFVSENSTAT
jgi:hypothetical protein